MAADLGRGLIAGELRRRRADELGQQLRGPKAERLLQRPFVCGRAERPEQGGDRGNREGRRHDQLDFHGYHHEEQADMSTRVITEVIFSGDVDDQPYLGDFYRLYPDQAGRTITGIEHNSGVSDGEEIVLFNVGPDDLTLAHDSAASAAANRFSTRTGADIVLDPGNPVWMTYSEDGPDGPRWYVED
jgi:hypothetical protein